MFVTTAGRTNEVMINKAKAIARELDIKYVMRNKRSVKALQQVWQDDCIVVGKERLELFPFGEKYPFFLLYLSSSWASFGFTYTEREIGKVNLNWKGFRAET